MFDTIISYSDDLLTALGGLVVFATFIAKLTPTPKDDAFIGKCQIWLEKFSVTSRNKNG